MADTPAPKFTTVVATNKHPGTRVIHAKTGAVAVKPGTTSEPIEVSEHELAVAKSTGWFDIAPAK